MGKSNAQPLQQVEQDAAEDHEISIKSSMEPESEPLLRESVQRAVRVVRDGHESGRSGWKWVLLTLSECKGVYSGGA